MSGKVEILRKAINPPYKRGDFVILFVTLLIFITIPLIVISVNNQQTLRTRAEIVATDCSLSMVSGDNTNPSVYFENPKEGERLVGNNFLIKIAAKDNTCVKKVFLLIDGATVKTFTAAPYKYSWNLIPTGAGNHTISAQVVDPSGNFSMASVLVYRGIKNTPIP